MGVGCRESKLNKNFKTMYDYLKSSYLVNIKWVNNNLEFK